MMFIMKTNKQKTNWLIDAGLFLAFLASFWLDLTGLSLHQWLGAAIGVTSGVHLLLHWNWVKSVTQRLFGHTSDQAWVYYWVDAALFFGLSLIVLTGLVISSWFSLALSNYALWKNLHVFVSIYTLVVLVLKIGLHWRWIVSSLQRYFLDPQVPQQVNSPVQPARPQTAISTGRRQFLSLMGIVSAAALLSIAGVVVQNDSADASEASVGQEVTTAQRSSIVGSSSGQCTVRCNRGCSFPGHCRRYVDSNGNNRCDLGECA